MRALEHDRFASLNETCGVQSRSRCAKAVCSFVRPLPSAFQGNGGESVGAALLKSK